MYVIKVYNKCLLKRNATHIKLIRTSITINYTFKFQSEKIQQGKTQVCGLEQIWDLFICPLQKDIKIVWGINKKVKIFLQKTE